MKIEKINDRQIRCTLTAEDLRSRNINIKELAYGSEKTRALFRDMMQVAQHDFGFEAENTPIVIEAIPLSPETIILIITKVDEPEELDTRFAQFSPEAPQNQGPPSLAELKEHLTGADEVLEMFKHMIAERRQSMENSAPNAGAARETAPAERPLNLGLLTVDTDVPNLSCAYYFRNLEEAILAASVLDTLYDGPNTLFKSDEEEGAYYLLLRIGATEPSLFNKVCNILSEYASPCKYTEGMEGYFNEHMEVLLADHALQDLKALV